MASHKIEYCRDRCFPTKHIPLPQIFHFGNDLKVIVNYARTDQLPDLQRMVEQAEKRGDNVGIDEFPSDSSVTDYIFHGSEIFAVSDPKTNSVEAFIVIHQCIYVRGYDPCLATIRIFRAASLASNDVAFGGLVRLAADFSAQIEYGYTHVLIDVAMCFTNLLKVLKSVGFTITATLPCNVDIAGVGFVDNAILMKPLGLSDRPPRSTAEVTDMLKRCCPCDEFMANYPTMQLPQVPFLPQRFTFKSGIKAILRNMRKEDDEIMYQLLTDSAEKGEGFAVTEYPDINYFRMHFLSTCYSVIIEEVDTKDIIGLSLLSSSWYTRAGNNCQHYGGDFVLNRKFRGKGIATEMMPIEFGIARELGFTRSVHDRFISNAPMAAAARHAGRNIMVGILPNAGYVKGLGWEDVVMGTMNFSQAPTLTELVKNNLKDQLGNSSKL